ncbi:MAG: glycosyltransferase family 39 protein [Chloroflexota bacterium]
MKRVITQPGLITVLVFLAALWPRLYALGAFLTIDEVKWAEGAAQFLIALSSGNLSATYWHFFPGVTISWGGALVLWGLCLPAADLAACAAAQVERLPESIGWLRLSPALLTSLGMAGVYALSRRLLGERAALLTALLLAFDPFFIAHSRILNGDAGAAILMFLSLLAFLIYGLAQAGQNPSFSSSSFLIFSGVFAGLALLTKLPAPLIGVFTGGLGLAAIVLDWRTAGISAVRRWGIALLCWGVVAGLTFAVLWPAMWTAPLDTLRLMYVDAFEVGGAGEGHDTFFMGQISADPGPWFYPYVIAFRLTPVVLAGLALAVGWLLLAGVRGQVSGVKCQVSGVKCQVSGVTFHVRFLNSPRLATALVMIAYISGIILFSNVSPKKLDRYVMSVIPALVLVAALGLDFGTAVAARLLAKSKIRYLQPAAILILTTLVALQLLSAVFAAPYYLTYYNPLLGDVRRIVDRAPVGWGEGLEQAALYLNSRPQAESLRVSSWYGDIFHPYFVGRPASFADDGRAQLGADYVVFYVNQLQRRKPFPGLIDYFRSHTPELVVAVQPTGRLASWPGGVNSGGVAWVEVYRAPAAQIAGGAPTVEGVAQLLAYKVTGERSAGAVAVTLYLRVLGALPAGATVDVALTRNSAWGRWQSMPPTGAWRVDQIVEWGGVLALPPDMPPGDYRLWVALVLEHGPVIAEFPISEKDPPLSLK